jgi:hypothetical protein
MPELCAPRRGFRHDVDAAVATLLRLGIAPDRIVVEGAGPGWRAGTVLRQRPAAGKPLGPRTRVVLSVAGAGGVDLLPYPLRDASEAPPAPDPAQAPSAGPPHGPARGRAAGPVLGVDALMALFDNPLHKLAIHVRAAGGFLALDPDDPAPTLRWIEEIFQLSAAPFPPEARYPLARLLPALHALAGTPRAVALAFGLVFSLPVARVRTVPALVPLDGRGPTRLGVAAARLGVDTVAGAGVVEAAGVEVTFGPLELADWRRHANPARRAERDALYRLVLPAGVHAAVAERWEVGSARVPLQLGHPGCEPRLGINARLGPAPERKAA